MNVKWEKPLTTSLVLAKDVLEPGDRLQARCDLWPLLYSTQAYAAGRNSFDGTSTGSDLFARQASFNKDDVITIIASCKDTLYILHERTGMMGWMCRTRAPAIYDKVLP